LHDLYIILQSLVEIKKKATHSIDNSTLIYYYCGCQEKRPRGARNTRRPAHRKDGTVDTQILRNTHEKVTPEMARAERALKLFADRGHEIKHEDADLYLVPSCTGRGFYLVDYEAETCNCADFIYNGHRTV